MQERFKSDAAFLDRMERYLLRKQDNTHRQQIEALSQDKDFTYTPKLNKKSENLKGRSVYELSFGDLIKKESTQRILKLRVEQEQLSQLTFQPELTELGKSAKISSGLKLNQNPSFHLELQKTKKEQLMKQRLIEHQKRQEQEIEGCTFQPKTIDCPDYIKRIAQSMNMIKTAKNQSIMNMSLRSSNGKIINNVVKPDWK